jgi:hypothetical protein
MVEAGEDELRGRFPCGKAGDDARERDPGGAHWHDFHHLFHLPLPGPGLPGITVRSNIEKGFILLLTLYYNTTCYPQLAQLRLLAKKIINQ